MTGLEFRRKFKFACYILLYICYFRYFYSTISFFRKDCRTTSKFFFHSSHIPSTDINLMWPDAYLNYISYLCEHSRQFFQLPLIFVISPSMHSTGKGTFFWFHLKLEPACPIFFPSVDL